MIIKLLVIGSILIIAPYVLPLSIELVLMADIMGLEALILFLAYQSKHAILMLLVRFSEWRSHLAATLLLLASVYMFQPNIFLSHFAGSGVILLFACSLALALALWVPAIWFSNSEKLRLLN